MNKLYYLIFAILILIILLLLRSIFFGENNYSNRNILLEESNELIKINDNLRKENEILEFEIKNAQDSTDHVENFARENLNLTYPDEEFIIFDDNDEKLDERR